MAKKQKQEEKVTFNYEGKDKRGQKIKGEMLALNSALARAELRRQGITPTKVVKKSQLSLLAFGSHAVAWLRANMVPSTDPALTPRCCTDVRIGLSSFTPARRRSGALRRWTNALRRNGPFLKPLYLR